jgi:hypothetical protein
VPTGQTWWLTNRHIGHIFLQNQGNLQNKEKLLEQWFYSAGDKNPWALFLPSPATNHMFGGVETFPFFFPLNILYVALFENWKPKGWKS